MMPNDLRIIQHRLPVQRFRTRKIVRLHQNLAVCC